MKLSGPLKKYETEKVKLFCIKYEQGKVEAKDNFKEDQSQLNLQKNATGIYERRGRIKSHYPICISGKPLLAEKSACKAHKRIIHRGVILTMAAINENYWILKLKQITKREIRICFGCKRFHTTQQKGILPSERATGTRPFQVRGTNFARLIMCRNKNGDEKKVYIRLFT